jgi:hypothetical protein
MAPCPLSAKSGRSRMHVGKDRLKASQKAILFDDLVGAGEQSWGDTARPNRLRGL